MCHSHNCSRYACVSATTAQHEMLYNGNASTKTPINEFDGKEVTVGNSSTLYTLHFTSY